LSKLACLAAVTFALAGSSQGGGTILFWTDSPIPSLRVMRADGTHVRRIAADQNAKRPSLSPDRKWVAFDGTPKGKPPLSDFDIQIVGVDGTQRRTIVGTGKWELDAQWSPDGKRLSFSRMPKSDWTRAVVCVVNVDGTGLKVLGPGHSARWSPDGTKLVLSATSGANAGDLYVVDANGGGRELLLSSDRHKAPAGWSRDGKHILFTQWHDSGGGVFMNGDVYVVDADGTHVRRLTGDLAEDMAAGWSPDGRQVLFTSDRNGGSQIFVMNLDRTHLRNLSGKRSNEFDPSWR
jgi:TolB protein